MAIMRLLVLTCNSIMLFALLPLCYMRQSFLLCFVAIQNFLLSLMLIHALRQSYTMQQTSPSNEDTVILCSTVICSYEVEPYRSAKSVCTVSFAFKFRQVLD